MEDQTMTLWDIARRGASLLKWLSLVVPLAWFGAWYVGIKLCGGPMIPRHLRLVENLRRRWKQTENVKNCAKELVAIYGANASDDEAFVVRRTGLWGRAIKEWFKCKDWLEEIKDTRDSAVRGSALWPWFVLLEFLFIGRGMMSGLRELTREVGSQWEHYRKKFAEVEEWLEGDENKHKNKLQEAWGPGPDAEALLGAGEGG